MDWLIENEASLECKLGKLGFKDNSGSLVTISRTQGKPTLQLVSATELLKAYKKKHMVYVVKLNPADNPRDDNEPQYL